MKEDNMQAQIKTASTTIAIKPATKMSESNLVDVEHLGKTFKGLELRFSCDIFIMDGLVHFDCQTKDETLKLQFPFDSLCPNTQSVILDLVQR